MNKDGVEMIDAVGFEMQQAVAHGVFPGAVLLVSCKGKIRFHQAFGVADIHTGENVTLKSVFDLASLTKPLATALSVMKLVEKKSLSLSMTVGDIIPAFPGTNKYHIAADKQYPATDKHHITIDQLLRHTSGLPAHRPFYDYLIDGGSSESQKNCHREDLRRLILKEPLVCLPGEKQIYSDLGYMILCWIIETITGIPFDVYVKNELYSPMGIEELFFVKLPPAPPSISEPVSPVLFSPDPLQPDPLQPHHLESPPLQPPHLLSPHLPHLQPADSQLLCLHSSRSQRGSLKPFHFVSTEICPWRGKTVRGEVHDDNAWVAGGVEGHAGLFGTAFGVWQILRELMGLICDNQYLKNYRKGYNDVNDVSKNMKKSLVNRNVLNLFLSGRGIGKMVAGFDTPFPSGSSAGKYFSSKSIGHLGFTGTSFWMDPEKDLIVVLLTNRIHPHRNNENIKLFRPHIHDLIVESLGLAS